MENKYDFQNKDKVYDLMFGNGFITAINIKNDRVVVKFSNNYNEVFEDELEDDSVELLTGYYNLQGEIAVITDEASNMEDDSYIPGQRTLRTLFHGHNLHVDVIEEKPKRPKYVNVYINENGEPFFGSVVCDKKELLQAEQMQQYVTTIELTPAHLKGK